MPQTVAFDTHKFVKRLTGAGMDEGIAEALTEGQIDFMNANLASKQDVAEIKQEIAEIKHDIEQLRADTKHDIEQLRANTKHDIEQLRANTDTKIAEVKQAIAEVKSDLIKWMSMLMVAQGGVVVALIKLL